MNSIKFPKYRKILLVALSVTVTIAGFLLMFITEPLTIKMILLVLAKLIGTCLFIGGFIVLKECLEHEK
jgi:hypothetical protein